MILKKKAYQTHELLLGAWRLESWEARDATGRVTYPLGEDARGQLSYDGSGRMSAQLMRQHQARFASQDWQQASEKEKAAAWGNYFGYFGTYTIDENCLRRAFWLFALLFSERAGRCTRKREVTTRGDVEINDQKTGKRC